MGYPGHYSSPLGLLFVVFLTRVVFRLPAEFSYPSLALVLEKRFPGLGDRLITAVELADVRRAAAFGYSPELIQQTIAEARERVAEVPLNSVFHWGRLRPPALLARRTRPGRLLLAYLGSGSGSPGRSRSPASPAASAMSSALPPSMQPAPAEHALASRAPGICGFPGPELRVGKDAPPSASASAFQWVLADSSTRDGWRPLAWADITPTFGLRRRRRSAPRGRRLVGRGPGQGPSSAPGLPRERPIAHRTVDLTKLTVDEVATSIGTADPDVATVYLKLKSLAARPAMSRTCAARHPSEVLLAYRGKPTQGQTAA